MENLKWKKAIVVLDLLMLAVDITSYVITKKKSALPDAEGNE